jgi:hypothetical protein
MKRTVVCAECACVPSRKVVVKTSCARFVLYACDRDEAKVERSARATIKGYGVLHSVGKGSYTP